MAPLIHRLPEALANQIAAGEVVQRPSSVLKELLENAIDAGATQVSVFLNDAGKTLIQVVDNGSGMGPEDARLCFERHATSKIATIEDLFAIRTMGFRGEALAAISSVARVELITRRPEDESGIRILMDASRLLSEEPVASAIGTSISVQHLFYNVPARRHFLRSATVELRRLVEEFQRIALSHPELEITLQHNGVELFQLRPANSRQRVVAVLGKAVNERLVPVSESTPLLGVEGFVGKPASARKTRGEQYFFLNGRFFRNNYLQHAVTSCYEKLIPEKHYPLFVLFLEMDPAQVDVNVHPGKEEVRFEDDKAVYALLAASVRHALSRYSAAPTLDFTLDPELAHLEAFQRPARRDALPGEVPLPARPASGGTSGRRIAPMDRGAGGTPPWEALFEIALRERAGDAESERVPERESGQPDAPDTVKEPGPLTLSPGKFFPVEGDWSEEESAQPVQLHRRYILCPVRSGLLLLDQRAAHERVLYEKYIHRLESGAGPSQRQLFPLTVELSLADSRLLEELLPAINALGFDLQPFGPQTFVVHGVPADCREMDERLALDELLESFRKVREISGLAPREKVARSLAKTYAIPAGKKLEQTEMKELIDRLFACQTPYAAPDGNLTCFVVGMDELSGRFRRRS